MAPSVSSHSQQLSTRWLFRLSRMLSTAYLVLNSLGTDSVENTTSNISCIVACISCHSSSVFQLLWKHVYWLLVSSGCLFLLNCSGFQSWCHSILLGKGPCFDTIRTIKMLNVDCCARKSRHHGSGSCQKWWSEDLKSALYVIKWIIDGRSDKEEVGNISIERGSVNSGYETQDGPYEDSETEADNRISEQSETDEGE
jgi:hypothetical protein